MVLPEKMANTRDRKEKKDVWKAVDAVTEVQVEHMRGRVEQVWVAQIGRRGSRAGYQKHLAQALHAALYRPGAHSAWTPDLSRYPGADICNPDEARGPALLTLGQEAAAHSAHHTEFQASPARQDVIIGNA